MDVTNRKWRAKPGVDALMEELRRLGYEYWEQIYDHHATGDPKERTPRGREDVWDDLKGVTKSLKALGVPGYYIMGNRGRLTRGDVERIMAEVS
ncbi:MULTISPECIES: hypothetical protein [Protofrankia]|uniref:Uncharacterized protein n=1 Tax=Protofrankia coriariae TaxID=1562887 RepID=A0ABR5F5W6_9ACTN|nr:MULTISPECIES: hypothetical protein [Protofrankia]KLL12126.1 hypothetical protein FrCorBMG51_06615 [Protofrankia coriariae]ONH37013.1 hypothetical protein BL254_04950 [Protofrankia sp. BMG5.30]